MGALVFRNYCRNGLCVGPTPMTQQWNKGLSRKYSLKTGSLNRKLLTNTNVGQKSRLRSLRGRYFFVTDVGMDFASVRPR
jgi:hypothetical protein